MKAEVIYDQDWGGYLCDADGGTWTTVDGGSECQVFCDDDRPDQILKVYRDSIPRVVVSEIVEVAKIAAEEGIGPAVLSGVITCDTDYGLCFGYITEKVEILADMRCYDDMEYGEYESIRRNLKDRMAEVFALDWWDNHDKNMGRLPNGEYCVIDFGLGVARGAREYIRR